MVPHTTVNLPLLWNPNAALTVFKRLKVAVVLRLQPAVVVQVARCTAVGVGVVIVLVVEETVAAGLVVVVARAGVDTVLKCHERRGTECKTHEDDQRRAANREQGHGAQSNATVSK
jgi:hypothetical protein